MQPQRLMRSHAGPLLALATLVVAAVVAGCGGTSSGPGPTASGRAAAGSRAARSSSSPSPGGSGPLAFARCMRANGVPSFADPSPGGGAVFPISAGDNSNTPAFHAAQAKCQKLLGGQVVGPGSTHASPQTLAKLVRIARCMREHGVPQFPDPSPQVPANTAGIREITNFDGAILLFPATLNMQAPAYRQALTACGAPPLGLPH